MQHGQAGFTLPETLIATAILVSGLAGMAWVFTMSINANMANRYRMAATLLASEKLEEFEEMAWNDLRWDPGGGLDPATPVDGHFDIIARDGREYLRLWQIAGEASRTVTVVVRLRPNGGPRQPPELIRLTTGVSPGRP